jgi:hypothetical protein
LPTDRKQESITPPDQSDQAMAIVEAEKHEIALYEKYLDYYSYSVYIAKKIRIASGSF